MSYHSGEPHAGDLAGRLNWLRAGVLGANDGIVSVAASCCRCCGCDIRRRPLITAGVAGLVGGAISMALGEYVSVSSQSDSQRALIEKSAVSLLRCPKKELPNSPRL